MNEVEAVKDKEDIRLVGHLLEKHGSITYRDIWELGINTALRISDLLSLKVADVADVEIIEVTEGKTKKKRSIKLNHKAQAIIQRRAAANPHNIYLFQGRRLREKDDILPLNRSTVGRKFQEVGEIVGVVLGTHSMRKTRGYAMYSDGKPIEVISKVLNHSSPAVTMRYLGIEKQDIHDTYDDYVL